MKIKIEGVRMASCANDYVSFINKEGKVFVIGDLNIKGVNNTKAKDKLEIIELPLKNIVKISSGINFSMALDDSGKVFAWGNNNSGQLGTGGLQSKF